MTVLDAYPWVEHTFCDVREEKGGAYLTCDCPLRNHSQGRCRFWLAADGRLLFGCYGCRTQDGQNRWLKSEMLRAVGAKWADCFPAGTKIERVHQECTAKYAYRDADGKLLYMTLRLEPGRNGRDKEFKQWRPNPRFDPKGPRSRDNPRGFSNLDGVPRVLYRLPELMKRRDETVYVVAGEKDADTLGGLGFLATTNVCGEQSEWLQSYSDALAGRRAVIIEDADAAGHRHANEVLGSVMRVTLAAGVVRLPQKDATAFILAEQKRICGASVFGEPDERELKRELRKAFLAECNQAKTYGWVPELGGVA